MEFFGMSFVEITVVIFLSLIAAITFKFVISFDFNKYIENRHNQRKEKLQILCPHTFIEEDEDGKLVTRSLFHSSSGTVWTCPRCGVQTNNKNFIIGNTKHYADNPRTWLAREKKFQRLFQKMYKYK